MRQFAWFDCVRCVAIFMVMYAHGGDFFQRLPAPIVPAMAALNSAAWTGVELFFVLSGFLVSGLLFFEHDKTGQLNIGRFLIRRAFKIIPPFYFLLIVTIFVDPFAGRPLKFHHLLHDFFFLDNYRIGTWGHAWTLALEVHFYILLAVLLYFLSRNAKSGAAWLKALPWILLGVLVVEFFARWFNSTLRGEGHHFDVHREIWPTHLALDVLAAGVLLRYLYNYHLESLALFKRAGIVWFILGLLLIVPSGYIWNSPHPALLTAFIPTGCALGFGLILFQMTQLPFPASGPLLGLVKPFDYLGKHSYSIYLWHLPVREWMINPLFPGTRGVEYFAAFFLASLAVGTFFSELLEMPVLRFRDWLFPSQARARPNAATA